MLFIHVVIAVSERDSEVWTMKIQSFPFNIRGFIVLCFIGAPFINLNFNPSMNK